MNTRSKLSFLVAPLAVIAALAPSGAQAAEEFDETKAIVEINASDGDIGFHAKYDADAWRFVKMRDPNNRLLLMEKASGPLAAQGLTENFFESAEPLCWDDGSGELIVTLEQFLQRFPAGDYDLYGWKNDVDFLFGTAELSHLLPAAPDISATDEMTLPRDGDDGEIIIRWAGGDDLGECTPDSWDMLPEAPGDVEVVAWEVVIEPDCDDVEFEPERTFTAQLPPETTQVTVSPEMIESYLDAGCAELKFEVGAIEETGNQTFSEGGFEVEEDD